MWEIGLGAGVVHERVRGKGRRAQGRVYHTPPTPLILSTLLTHQHTNDNPPPPPPPAIHSDSTRRNLYSKFFAIYGSPDGGLPEFEFRLRVGGRGEGSMGRSNG